VSGVAYPAADGITLPAHVWTTVPAAAANVPLIISYCSDETTIFSMASPQLFQLDWPNVPAQMSLQTGVAAEKLVPVVDAYRAAFPQDNPSDCLFRMSAELRFGKAPAWIADLKSTQPPPVYFYRMDYDTKIQPGLRAFHTAELPLTIGLVSQPEAAGLSSRISSAWAAFARTLDPNNPVMPAWRPYDTANRAAMIFDLTTRCIPDDQAALRTMLLEVTGASSK
jgi:para-nitrobenzyl esterase